METQHSPSRPSNLFRNGIPEAVSHPMPHGARSGLTLRERALALLSFVLWLIVFAGGILIDTRPYRIEISTGGVAALEQTTEQDAGPAIQPVNESTASSLIKAWLIVLIWFLPLNLALLCAISGTLGAFGNRANLQDDRSPVLPHDASNPYVSALLRGFFIYLIMISGLLLLDDDPFSNPSPGQYIRLAGFLSLFSFVVNYNPQIFEKLLVLAVERIQAKGGQKQREVAEVDVQYTRATAVEVATIHRAPDPPASSSETPAQRSLEVKA